MNSQNLQDNHLAMQVFFKLERNSLVTVTVLEKSKQSSILIGCLGYPLKYTHMPFYQVKTPGDITTNKNIADYWLETMVIDNTSNSTRYDLHSSFDQAEVSEKSTCQFNNMGHT